MVQAMASHLFPVHARLATDKAQGFIMYLVLIVGENKYYFYSLNLKSHKVILAGICHNDECLFYPGTVEESEYCDLLQLEECEFRVISTASRARCLFQCGNERYKLLIQAPEYKQEMFGTEGGR